MNDSNDPNKLGAEPADAGDVTPGAGSRRALLRAAVASAGGVAALLSGLPERWAGRAFASDAPERPKLRVGFVAVQSAAPLIVAKERGIFEKHGLEVTLSKENGWAAARDKLNVGENQATHLKYAQAIASSMGLLGTPEVPTLAPFTMSRNGSAFMVAQSLKGKLTFDPKSWKVHAEVMKKEGSPLTIALPVPFGFHGLMYRYFLANAGINADKELKLVTLPPAQMVQNLRVGSMQACAMVEPWGARGVYDKVSTIVMYGHEMWRDHPVKTLGMLQSFADQSPKTARALVRAVAEAAAWCDDFAHRPELAKMLAPTSYMNSIVETISAPLMGAFDWGDGRKRSDPSQTIFYNRDNYPQPREMKWFMTQFLRWGMVKKEPDYDALAAKIGRPELYEGAMKDLGVTPHAKIDAPIKLWDGKIFEHQKAAEYARSFAVHSLPG